VCWLRAWEPSNGALAQALTCGQPWSGVTVADPVLWHACGTEHYAWSLLRGGTDVMCCELVNHSACDRGGDATPSSRPATPALLASYIPKIHGEACLVIPRTLADVASLGRTLARVISAWACSLFVTTHCAMGISTPPVQADLRLQYQLLAIVVNSRLGAGGVLVYTALGRDGG
jgi:hypothetical protein